MASNTFDINLVVFNNYISHMFTCSFCQPSINWWRFGVAVTRWSRSTQLLYIEPG